MGRNTLDSSSESKALPTEDVQNSVTKEDKEKS